MSVGTSAAKGPMRPEKDLSIKASDESPTRSKVDGRTTNHQEYATLHLEKQLRRKSVGVKGPWRTRAFHFRVTANFLKGVDGELRLERLIAHSSISWACERRCGHRRQRRRR